MSPALTVPSSSPLPLSALLSQTLIAFTIELDNEFERQMLGTGFRGVGLSLAVWSNLFRFISEEGITVGDLTTLASGPSHHMLPCLERWRFLTLTPPESEPPLRMKSHRRIPGLTVREGYGSGRDIRRDWIVRLTPKGLQARAVWPPLFNEIEGRWRTRFGASDVDNLRPMRRLSVPAQRYALFPHTGHVSTIRSTYSAIWNQVLPENGWTTPEAPGLERHHSTFDPLTGEGGITIWIPIVKVSVRTRTRVVP